MISTRQILDREHDGIMEHCEAVTGRTVPSTAAWYARSQSRKGMKGYGRPLRDLMAEYEAQLAASSINMINFNSNPWS